MACVCKEISSTPLSLSGGLSSAAAVSGLLVGVDVCSTADASTASVAFDSPAFTTTARSIATFDPGNSNIGGADAGNNIFLGFLVSAPLRPRASFVNQNDPRAFLLPHAHTHAQATRQSRSIAYFRFIHPSHSFREHGNRIASPAFPSVHSIPRLVKISPPSRTRPYPSRVASHHVRRRRRARARAKNPSPSPGFMCSSISRSWNRRYP